MDFKTVTDEIQKITRWTLTIIAQELRIPYPTFRGYRAGDRNPPEHKLARAKDLLIDQLRIHGK